MQLEGGEEGRNAIELFDFNERGKGHGSASSSRVKRKNIDDRQWKWNVWRGGVGEGVGGGRMKERNSKSHIWSDFTVHTWIGSEMHFAFIWGMSGGWTADGHAIDVDAQSISIQVQFIAACVIH